MLYHRYPDLALYLHGISPSQLDFNEVDGKIDDDTEALYICGLSKLSANLRSWLFAKPARQLIFLEERLSAIAAFPQELLSHPQIHLKWTTSSWDPILEACSAQFPFGKIEVLIADPKHKTFRQIRESLLRRTLLWHSATSEEISGHLLKPNVIANLQRLPHCFYVNHWQNRFSQIPAIICGAGPSLETVADDLKTYKNRALLMAGGSALSALSHLGIRPHLGLAADPNPREFDCLKGCRFRDLPLLFASRLYSKVFELFDGPYGYMRCGSGGSLEQHIEAKLGLTEPYLGQDMGREALSITTVAVSLARFLGCNPIILAGVDLSVAKNYYAKGVPVKTAPLLDTRWEKNGLGQRVRTTLKWVMERDVLDAFAKNCGDLKFFNTSERGLKFKHFASAQLKEILVDEFEIDKQLETLIAKTKFKCTQEQIAAQFTALHHSMKTCATLIDLLQQESPESGKAALFEHDLRQEMAYQLLLANPRLAFERLTSSQHSSVWNFLKEVSLTYLH
jgi:hypothetical protein